MENVEFAECGLTEGLNVAARVEAVEDVTASCLVSVVDVVLGVFRVVPTVLRLLGWGALIILVAVLNCLVRFV